MSIFVFLKIISDKVNAVAIREALSGEQVIFLDTLKGVILRENDLLITSLPVEIAVRINHDINCTHINLTTEFGMVLSGMMDKRLDKLGIRFINSIKEHEYSAPVIVPAEDLCFDMAKAEVINSFLKAGQKIKLYSEFNCNLKDEVVGSNYIEVNRIAGLNVFDRIQSLYIEANKSNTPTIFISCFNLEKGLKNIPPSDNVLLITPQRLILGIEYLRRASPEYAVEELIDEINSNNINIRAIRNIAVLSLTAQSDLMPALKDKLDIKVIGYDYKRFVERKDRFGLSSLLALTDIKDGNLIITNKDLRNGIVFSISCPAGNLANINLS